MMTTDLRCWSQNHYVGDFFRYVYDFLNVLNRSPKSWIGHQHLKLVTNTFGRQHPSPTSMWPNLVVKVLVINHESLRYRHHQEFQVLLETWGFHNRHFSNHRHQSPGNGHEDINHKMEVMEVTWLHFLSPVMDEINTLVLKQKIQALLSKQRLYRKSFERNRKKTWLYKNFDMKSMI